MPKRIAERISHRLGPPALFYGAPSPTLAQWHAGVSIGTVDMWAKEVEAAMAKPTLISVVDDDQPFRESMKKLMTALGHTVEAFPSAADFLASPLLGATACLVSDVHMPGMTGIELHRRLLAMGHRIPTILVTAYPDEIARKRAYKDGVVCYVSKPVDDEHLERCLRSAIETGEPHEETS